MLFKVLLLVAVCSMLVASKDLPQRDAQTGGELKKTDKRDDDVAKKAALEGSLLADVAFDMGKAVDAVAAGTKILKKRFAGIDEKDQKQCCG